MLEANSESSIQKFYRVPKTSHRIIKQTERLHLFNFTACWVQCMHWKPHTCWCATIKTALAETRTVSCQTESGPWNELELIWQIPFSRTHWHHQRHCSASEQGNSWANITLVDSSQLHINEDIWMQVSNKKIYIYINHSMVLFLQD